MTTTCTSLHKSPGPYCVLYSSACPCVLGTTLLLPFYRWGETGLERFNNWPQEPGSGQTYLSPACHHLFFFSFFKSWVFFFNGHHRDALALLCHLQWLQKHVAAQTGGRAALGHAASCCGSGLLDPDTMDVPTWRSRRSSCCCRKCSRHKADTDTDKCGWTPSLSGFSTFLFFIKIFVIIILLLSRKDGWLEMWNFSVWTGYLYIFLTVQWPNLSTAQLNGTCDHNLRQSSHKSKIKTDSMLPWLQLLPPLKFLSKRYIILIGTVLSILYALSQLS